MAPPAAMSVHADESTVTNPSRNSGVGDAPSDMRRVIDVDTAQVERGEDFEISGT